MCRVKDFNLSYESLTGYMVRDRLRNLKKTDPEFWQELMAASAPEPTNTEKTFVEDNAAEDTFFDDDSNLPCTTIITHVVTSNLPEHVASTADGCLVSTAEAESLKDITEPSADSGATFEAEELGPGKRKRRPNTMYKSSMFWRHHDNEDPNKEPDA